MRPPLYMLLLLVAAQTALADEAAARGQDAPGPAAAGKAEERTEERAREDDMFGGAPADPASQAAKPAAPAPSPLDEPLRSRGLISDLLQRADDPLTIGGKLSLRFHYTWADEHADDEHLLSSPSVLYLFLDARPSDRLRAFARGRLTYDFTLQDGEDTSGLPAEALDVTLDQLWLKADIFKVVYLTLGRQPIRWGSGHFWNPTDFLNQELRDPLAIFDERIGPTLVKLHFPVESLGWNFYAVAGLDLANHPDEIFAALRGELLLGPMELCASAGYGRDQPLKLGLDLSAGVWLLDLRAEAAFTYADERPYWTGRFDAQTGEQPRAETRDDRWIPQINAGIEAQMRYSDEDYLVLGAEYFFNGAGYEDAKLYDWLLFRTAMGERGFTPFYLGQHYAAGYLMLPYPGSWNDTTVTLSGIGNLSDRSGILRLDWQVRLLTYLDLALFAAVRLGDEGEFHYGVDVPPLTGVLGVPEAYQNGFSIPAGRLEAGIWLTMAI